MAMARSDIGKLGALSIPLARAGKRGSHKDLAAAVSSDEFVRRLLMMPPELRVATLTVYARAFAKCEELNPLIPKTVAKVTWDEVRVARLKKLAAIYPENRDLALAMGLSIAQVERARLRFVARGEKPSPRVRPVGADATVNLGLAA